MVKILDTTLRDGSYVVDFQFTAQDTSTIASLLDASNIHFIEVGHGLGLNGSSNEKMKAASSDSDYLEAASKAITKAKWGMFFIPGIGTKDDIKRATDYGMKFIRIGTNVNQVAESEPFIKLARSLGLTVFSNFMKSYALPPDEVGKFAKDATDFGSDFVCIVDSAGGMLPDDVEKYVEAIKKRTNIALGFHGHNNLGLVIANCLRAVEIGVQVIDTSLRGIGRSAGNAATEIFLLALKRKGIDLGIDPIKILDIAEKNIDPVLKNHPQVDSIGIVSGYAQFHSGFIDSVMSYAEQYNVDVRKLIIHLCQEDRINAPASLINRIAKELSQQRDVPQQISAPLLHRNKSSKPESLGSMAQAAVQEAHSNAKKYGKKSVFNIVQTIRKAKQGFVSSAIYSGSQYTVSSAEIRSAGEAKEIAEAVDGIVDIVFMDSDIKSKESIHLLSEVAGAVKKSLLLTYSDLDAWSKSIIALVKQKLQAKVVNSRIGIAGNNLLAEQCHAHSRLLGAEIIRFSKNITKNDKKLNVFICCDKVDTAAFINILADDAIVIDGLIGGLNEEILSHLNKKKLQVFRPDMRVVMHNEISTAVGMRSFDLEIQGTRTINDIAVCAGGIIAQKGTVIVDSIKSPSRVFGIADGKGFLLPENELNDALREKIKIIEKAIL